MSRFDNSSKQLHRRLYFWIFLSNKKTLIITIARRSTSSNISFVFSPSLSLSTGNSLKFSSPSGPGPRQKKQRRIPTEKNIGSLPSSLSSSFAEGVDSKVIRPSFSLFLLIRPLKSQQISPAQVRGKFPKQNVRGKCFVVKFFL